MCHVLPKCPSYQEETYAKETGETRASWPTRRQLTTVRRHCARELGLRRSKIRHCVNRLHSVAYFKSAAERLALRRRGASAQAVSDASSQHRRAAPPVRAGDGCYTTGPSGYPHPARCARAVAEQGAAWVGLAQVRGRKGSACSDNASLPFLVPCF